MWTVIGHESIVQALARSLSEGRLSHAYLFTGPQSVGKMTLAVDLACALNCASLEKPCGVCLQCKRVREGKHSDVQVISVASEGDEAQKEISIKQIEALQEAASLAPFEGLYRVFIIENAELLNINAANRLLKTLEEPAGRVCIVLLTREPAKLPSTVVSRCRVYDLRPVPPNTIVQALVKYDVDKEKARDLARMSEGRIGWAINAAQNPAVEETRRDEVDQIAELLEAGYVERLQMAGRIAQDYTRRREEVNDWLSLMRQFWRDVLLIKGSQPEAVVNTDRLALLERVAHSLTFPEIAGAVREVESTVNRLRLNANPRLALDVFVLHLPLVQAPPAPDVAQRASTEDSEES